MDNLAPDTRVILNSPARPDQTGDAAAYLRPRHEAIISSSSVGAQQPVSVERSMAPLTTSKDAVCPVIVIHTSFKLDLSQRRYS